jgi:hypothetical protein
MQTRVAIFQIGLWLTKAVNNRDTNLDIHVLRKTPLPAAPSSMPILALMFENQHMRPLPQRLTQLLPKLSEVFFIDLSP